MAAQTTTERWTIADLARFPDTGFRYEIIDGELHVSKQPHWHHQFVCGQVFALLQDRPEYSDFAPSQSNSLYLKGTVVQHVALMASSARQCICFCIYTC